MSCSMPRSWGWGPPWTERNVPSGHEVTYTAEMGVIFSSSFLSLKPDSSEWQKPTHTLEDWELRCAERQRHQFIIPSWFLCGERMQCYSDKEAEMDFVCVRPKSFWVCRLGSLGCSHTQPIIGHLESPIWEKALVNIWNDVCGCRNWNYLAPSW